MKSRVKRIQEYLRKTSHTDNQEVNELMNTWQQRFGRSNFTIIFLIVVSEIIYGFISKILGIEDKSWPEYFRFYVISPGLTSIFILVLWQVAMRYLKSYYLRAMATLFTLFITFSAIVVANYDRVVFQSIIVIPMFISVIYEDAIVFYSTFVLTMIIHLVSVGVMYLENGSDKLPQFFTESTILTILIILISGAFARLVLNFELKKREIEASEYTSNEQLKNEVLYDELTKIQNYAGFNRDIKELVSSFNESRDICYLAILDIDFFKKVNDTYGHEMGNVVLRRLGSILLENENRSIIPARFGGEEFAILFKNMDREEVMARLQFITQRFKSSEFDGISSPITLSAGVAKYYAGTSAEDFFKQADAELYRAKNTGRDNIVWADNL